MGLCKVSDEAYTSASVFLCFLSEGEISGYLRFHKEAVMMSDEVDASQALGNAFESFRPAASNLAPCRHRTSEGCEL